MIEICYTDSESFHFFKEFFFADYHISTACRTNTSNYIKLLRQWVGSTEPTYSTPYSEKKNPGTYWLLRNNTNGHLDFVF